MAPQVPTYDEFQVAPSALPDVRVADTQPGNPSLQVGQGLEQLGTQLQDSAIRLQRQQNADSLFKAEAALKESYLQFETTAKQRQGQDSWGVAADTAKWWQENYSRVADELGNDEQRQMFAKTIAPLKLQSLSTMSSFEQQQRKLSVEQTANASVESSINLAAANPNSPDIIAQSRGDILKRVQVVGDLNGYTPEMRAAAQTEQLTKLHSQVIGSLIDTNPDQAKAYLDANRGEIAGTQLDSLDKAVRTGTIAQQSQTASADILSRHTDEASALADARKNFTGQVQDAITTRIRERFAEAEQIKQRGEKDAADKGWQILTQGGGYSAIPPSLLNSMSGESVKALQDEATRRAKGSQIETNWPVYEQLRNQIFADPTKPLNIVPYLSSLGESERKSLIDIQTSLMSPSTKHDAVTVEKQLNDAIAQLGYPKTATKVQRETIGQLKAQADQAFQDFSKAHGRAPIDTERQAILDRLVQPGTVPGRIYGTNDMRYIEAQTRGQTFTPSTPTPTLPPSTPVRSIPQKDRDQITAALKVKGKPVTEDAVQYYYSKAQGLQ